MATISQGGEWGDLYERIQANAMRRLFNRTEPSPSASNLFLQREVLQPDTVISSCRQRIRVEEPTVMVFADERPGANWGHPCRYLLYQLETGRVRELSATWPPYLTKFPETFQMFYRGFSFEGQGSEGRSGGFDLDELRGSARPPQHDRYAVLFSGLSNYHHVNDLEFLYRTLVDVYAYPEDQIYVLNFDGTADYAPDLIGSPLPSGIWPGDNTPFRMKVSAAGTRPEFEAVIDDLKNRLGREDSLFIHTSNHGDNPYASLHPQAQSFILDANQADYFAGDFASKLDELPQFHSLMVMMEQCNSGGFRRFVMNLTSPDLISFACACGEFAQSYRQAHFDAFACAWVSAMNGADPFNAPLQFDPDVDGNGGVTSREAFDYANHNSVVHPQDTPEYDESSASAGDFRLDS